MIDLLICSYLTGVFISLGICAMDYEDDTPVWVIIIAVLSSWFLVGAAIRKLGDK